MAGIRNLRTLAMLVFAGLLLAAAASPMLSFLSHGAQGTIALIRQDQLAPEARLPVGTVLMFAGSAPPDGWLVCDGAAVSRTQYAKLFAIVGTAYGAGDGATTFNVPNFKGRFPAGHDPSDADFRPAGKTGGEKAHALTVNEMPAHAHTVKDVSNTYEGVGGGGSLKLVQYAGGQVYQTTSAGAGAPHGSLPPYQVVSYVIRY